MVQIVAEETLQRLGNKIVRVEFNIPTRTEKGAEKPLVEEPLVREAFQPLAKALVRYLSGTCFLGEFGPFLAIPVLQLYLKRASGVLLKALEDEKLKEEIIKKIILSPKPLTNKEVIEKLLQIMDILY